MPNQTNLNKLNITLEQIHQALKERHTYEGYRFVRDKVVDALVELGVRRETANVWWSREILGVLKSRQYNYTPPRSTKSTAAYQRAARKALRDYMKKQQKD